MRTVDQPAHGVGDEDLARTGSRGNAGDDMGGDADDVGIANDDLAGVYPDVERETEIRRIRDDFFGEPERRSGERERGEESVTGRDDLPAREPGERMPHRLPVRDQEVAPACVS